MKSSSNKKALEDLYYAKHVIDRDKKNIDLSWTWFVGKTKIEIENEINKANPNFVKLEAPKKKASFIDKIAGITIHNNANADGIYGQRTRYGMRDVSNIQFGTIDKPASPLFYNGYRDMNLVKRGKLKRLFKDYDDLYKKLIIERKYELAQRVDKKKEYLAKQMEELDNVK